MRTSKLLLSGCMSLVMWVCYLQNACAAVKVFQDPIIASHGDTIIPEILSKEKKFLIDLPAIDSISKVYLHDFANYGMLDSPKIVVSNLNRSFMPMNTGSLFLKSASKVALIHSVSLMFLFSSSKEVTNWEYDFSPELFEHAGENLKKAWTSLPRWDNDPFKTNYLQHPYAGSFYYNLVRNKGATWRTSFAFSVISSTLFEYFTEAMFERPSTQDLFITPVIGSLLGEASHQITMEMARNGFNAIEKIVVLFINPAYVLNHGFKVPTEFRRKQLQQTKRNTNVFRPV